MSPRKRTPDKESSETSTAVAEPPSAESPVAVAELAPEANATGQGFAERVGKKAWVPAPDPFGIAVDNVAAVRLFESKQDRQMAIKFGEGRFEDKPSQAVIDTLKSAGYRWNPSDRIWARPVQADSAMTTRIEAKRLYNDVCQMIRQEKGAGSEQGLPF